MGWASVTEVCRRETVDRRTVYRWIARHLVRVRRLPGGEYRLFTDREGHVVRVTPGAP